MTSILAYHWSKTTLDSEGPGIASVYMFSAADDILEKIEEAGFTVAMQKVMQLSKEQAEEFYQEHRGEEYFDDLTTTMSR